MSGASLLIVGGGVTSAITASLLASHAPQLGVAVWDKARGAGGRMATSRGPTAGSTVDLGAQYLSPGIKYIDTYTQLEAAGVISRLDPALVRGIRGGADQTHYTVPAGMSSLVKHWFQQAGLQAGVQFGRRVERLDRQGSGWNVSTVCGLQQYFDMVLLTMPVPQVLQLTGDIADVISSQPAVAADLAGVEYSVRWVLGLFYPQAGMVDTAWAAQYLDSHPVLRFIAVDNVKRGRPDLPSSILLHSTVRYALDNKDANPDTVKAEMLSSLQELHPAWPEPESVKTLRWLYSQVHTPYPRRPGAVVLAPNLFLAGDAFTTSNLDGCLESAHTVAQMIADLKSDMKIL